MIPKLKTLPVMAYYTDCCCKTGIASPKNHIRKFLDRITAILLYRSVYPQAHEYSPKQTEQLRGITPVLLLSIRSLPFFSIFYGNFFIP